VKELSSKLDSNPLNDCHDALLDYGLIIEHPILDGQFRNTPVLGHNPKKKVGWYVGQEISISGGKTIVSATYGDFRKGVSHTFKSSSKGNSALTKADREKYQQAMEANQKLVDAEKAEAQGRAAKTAQVEFNQLSDTGTSQYLKRKQVSGHGVKYGNRFIAIPIMGINGVLRGIQKIFDAGNVFYDGTISKTGDKRFGGNVEIKGAFHLLGDITTDTTTLYFAEGYSTAAAVYEAVNIPTVCCFNATNLPKVIEQYRAKYPNIQFIIAADDDQFADTNGNEKPNTGKIAAGKAANKYRCLIVSPTFKDLSTKPTDFNDLLVLSGTHAVKQQLSTKTALEPHYPHPDYIPSRTISFNLSKIINDWTTLNPKTSHDPAITVIKSSAGAGKSSAVIEIANKNLLTNKSDAPIHLFVPEHKLGSSFKKGLNGTVVQIHGRNQVVKGQDGEEIIYCKRNDVAQEMIAAGVSVSDNLCGKDDNKCEFYDTCPYIQQFKTKADFVVTTHANLALGHNSLEAKPAKVIIDESFYDVLGYTSLATDIGTIFDSELLNTNLKTSICQAMQSNSEGKGFYDSLRELVLPYANGEDDANDYIIYELSKILKSKKVIDSYRSNIDPSLSDLAIKHKLLTIKKYTNETRLIRAITLDLEQFPDRADGTRVSIHGGKFKVHVKKPKTRLDYFHNNDIPVLAIDADAHPLICDAVFGSGNYNFHTILAKRRGTVTQYVNAVQAKSKFFKSELNELGEKVSVPQRDRINTTLKQIKKIASNGKKTVLVTYKILREEIEAELNALGIDVIHFGRLRGLNDYEEHEQIIILGRNQPPAYSLEDTARWLFANNNTPIQTGELIREIRTIRTTDPLKATSVPTHIHSDKRVQVLMEQKRESEVLQAIDRIRLIHAKEINGKVRAEIEEVHIIANLVLDIDIDFVSDTANLREYKYQTLMGIVDNEGVLCASPEFLLEKYGSEKFNNIKQIDNQLQSLKVVYNNTIYRKKGLLFRLKSQKGGRSKTAYYSPKLSLQEIKIKLEEQIGEEIYFPDKQTLEPLPSFFAGIEPLSHAVSPALDQADIEEIAHDAYIERQELMQEMLLEHFQDFEQDIMGFEYEYHGYMLPS